MNLEKEVQAPSRKMGRRLAFILGIATGLVSLVTPLWAQTQPKSKIELFSEMRIIPYGMVAGSSPQNYRPIPAPYSEGNPLRIHDGMDCIREPIDEKTPASGVYFNGQVKSIRYSMPLGYQLSDKGEPIYPLSSMTIDRKFIEIPRRIFLSSYNFDNKGRLTKRVKADENCTNTFLNGNFDLPIIRDETYEYDSKGRLIKLVRNPDELNPIKGTDTYVYDEKGRLANIIIDYDNDTNGSRYVYNYDEEGRLSQIELKEGKEGDSQYNSLSRLIINNYYDLNGKLVIKKIQKARNRYHIFSYNPAGRSSYVGDSYDYTEFNEKYDNEGRLVEGYPDLSLDNKVTYDWTSNNRFFEKWGEQFNRYILSDNSVELTYSPGSDYEFTVSYKYDVMGNILETVYANPNKNRIPSERVLVTSTRKYDYEFDEYGNWIKRSEKWILEQRKSAAEVSVRETSLHTIYRDITYYPK